MVEGQNKQSILLVDASKVFQQIFNSYFGGDNYNVTVAKSGQQALDLVDRHRFEMICSALYLDDMEGIELCGRIREREAYSHIAFILFTSENIPRIQQKLLPAGVTDIFHKSEVQELVNFIRRYSFDASAYQGRLLYVEDSEAQRTMIGKIFRGHGLRVDEFSNAEEALRIFPDNEYDLVVTDVVLEGNMSGLVLANRIRRMSGDQGDVPILAITAFDDDSRRIELFHMGISDYVIKPVQEMELMARVRNLLARRKLFNELRAQRALADEANIAKSTFLSAMSHELRTPLNAVLGFSELLQIDEQNPLPPAQLDYVKEIHRAGNHLLELVNEVLDLSKIEAGKMNVRCEPTPLLKLLTDCLAMVRAQTEAKHISIGNPQISTELQVLADPFRLKQVMLNLLSNAIKYNRSNGSVDISVTASEKNAILISVKDSGYGMNPEQQALIFQPFSRLKSHGSIEGTGIGLVISRSLVELMNGELSFTSEPDRGSCFTVRLAAAPAAE